MPSTRRFRVSRRVAAGLAVALLLGAACASSERGGVTEPSGPPEIQGEVVAEHAAQFDDKLARRPAGSQQEFATATYILAHLQAGGYAPLLDPVPVEDLIRSTNVVADPPRGGEPATVVAIAYDTGPESLPQGDALGLWLELARALYARNPGHSTAFAALGAEHASLSGGELGARRLAEFLIDRKLGPVVVVVGRISESGRAFAVSGTGAAPFEQAAARLGIDVEGAAPSAGAARVFGEAGFRQATVSGSVDAVGRVLLEALSGEASASPSGSPR